MEVIKLQVFENICAKCGKIFSSLHLPQHIYGPVLFTTQNLEAFFLFPDEDNVWEEVSELINKNTQQNKLTDDDLQEIFDVAISRTIDIAANNEEAFIWGKIPCIGCNELERTFCGPKEPAEFVEVDKREVSHKKWHTLSNSKKNELIEQIVHEYVEHKGRAT